MRNLRKSLTRTAVAALILFVACALTLFTGERHAHAAPGGPDVTVVNTTANPVPTTLVGTSAISGNVSVVNTPTVNAQQSGAWNVGINGTPNVNVTNVPSVSIAGTPSVSIAGTTVVSLAAGTGLTVANALDPSGNPIPLLIRDADNGARHPYSTTCQNFGAMSTNNLATCNFNPPPAGTRFVVETTTGGCQIPQGNRPFQLAAGVFNGGMVLSLEPVFTANANSTDNFVINSTQRFYVDPGLAPGQVFGFNFGSTDTSGGTFCFLTLSGYLVNLP